MITLCILYIMYILHTYIVYMYLLCSGPTSFRQSNYLEQSVIINHLMIETFYVLPCRWFIWLEMVIAISVIFLPNDRSMIMVLCSRNAEKHSSLPLPMKKLSHMHKFKTLGNRLPLAAVSGIISSPSMPNSTNSTG